MKLPSDVVWLMDTYGRVQLGRPPAGAPPRGTWTRRLSSLRDLAALDEAAFVAALARAVVPAGGWAALGAARALPAVTRAVEGHPGYEAIMDAAIAFLRDRGVPSNRTSGTEWTYWLARGGRTDTWLTPRPLPDVPPTPLGPAEVRPIARLDASPDSRTLYVRMDRDDRYVTVVESGPDGRRARRDRDAAGSLALLYRRAGAALQVPPHWCDAEFGAYIPYPRPRLDDPPTLTRPLDPRAHLRRLVAAAPGCRNAPIVDWDDVEGGLRTAGKSVSTALAASWCVFETRHIGPRFDRPRLAFVFPDGIVARVGRRGRFGGARSTVIPFDRVSGVGPVDATGPRGVGIEFAGAGGAVIGRLRWSCRESGPDGTVASERDRVLGIVASVLD